MSQTLPTDEFRSQVAPEGVDIQEDHLEFPGAVLLPISVRGAGVPGMNDRPWSNLNSDRFIGKGPMLYSVTARREAPDVVRNSLRIKRTAAEGLLTVLAVKAGRRPSMAEVSQDASMDAAESAISLGKPIYKVGLLAAVFAARSRQKEAEGVRRTIEAELRGAGLLPQRLIYIVERALRGLQPGGPLSIGMDEPLLFQEEARPLFPSPSYRVLPTENSVWIGMHKLDGRDIHYSFTDGFDPSLPKPPHAMTVILGEQGSGKTTLMRYILLQRYLQGRTILTLDPEGENNNLCLAMGGRVVPASAPSEPDTCLLHPLQADNPEEMLLATRFLVSALAGNALTPAVNAALHEAVKRRWSCRPGPMSISELVETLGTINTADATTAVNLLQPFAAGGILGGYFDRPKALITTKIPVGQWLNFDLSKLHGENQEIIHAVLAWFLYRVVTVERQPMDIYTDEGWRLLREGPFADLLDELGRRARKRGIGVTLATHLPGDVAKNSSLRLASTAFVGRLGVEEAYTFFRSMGISESESKRHAEQVKRLPPYTFMAVSSGGRTGLIPVIVIIPPLWLDYWKQIGASTDGREMLNAGTKP